MKRVFCFFTILIFIFSLSSCGEERNAYSLLSEFIELYSAEGIIYSPEVAEGKEGYITEDTFRKIYLYYGDAPKNYAVFLNSHIDTGSECGVFVCRDESERAVVSEALCERIRLLCGGDDNGIIITSSYTVFYSTMSDKVLAQSAWERVLRSRA